MSRRTFTAPGPFLAEHIRSGDPYELSNGHPIFCTPTRPEGGKANALGAAVLGSDPDVRDAGIDVGYTQGPGHLRAPDVSVGEIPSTDGWVKGVPPLAVEYADKGQDEGELQEKIQELLSGGTKYLWVVRMQGPRRVEVYEPGRPMRVLTTGQVLSAPGVLRNDVPVEALYDKSVAQDVTLRNLLQRRGYESLTDVRAEGRKEGREEGREEGRAAELRTAIADLCELLGIELPPAKVAEFQSLGAQALSEIRDRLKRDRTL